MNRRGIKLVRLLSTKKVYISNNFARNLFYDPIGRWFNTIWKCQYSYDLSNGLSQIFGHVLKAKAFNNK